MGHSSRRPVPVILLVLSALVLAGLACSSFNFSFGTDPTPSPVPPTPIPPTPRPTLPPPPTATEPADEVVLTLINQSANDVCFVRISSVSSSEWGEDWLGADIVSSGSSYTFLVAPGAYDLRAEFCGGGSVEEMAVDLTSEGTWTISDTAAGPGPSTGGTVQFTVINQTTTAVCFVYISPTTSEYWDEDWLGSDTIPAGGSYVFSVPSGSYDLRADFCGGGDPYVEWARSITSASTWAIPASAAAGGSSSGTAGALDYSLESNYGSRSLTSGFTPDPQSILVTSGGNVDVSSALGSGCGGYATSAPDFEVSYTSGTFSLLRFYFVASAGGDTTLIINAPDANWYCNDDSFSTLNPTIDFQNPSSGTYDIWVGSYASGQFVSGTLYITEVTSNHP
jgi:hypothetical protein